MSLISRNLHSKHIKKPKKKKIEQFSKSSIRLSSDREIHNLLLHKQLSGSLQDVHVLCMQIIWLTMAMSTSHPLHVS